MAHLHTDMERFDVHVALEVCEIVIESATIVANLESRRRRDRSPESSDGNDPPPLRYGAASSRSFDDRRLGLVGDQLAQERNETEGSET